MPKQGPSARNKIHYKRRRKKQITSVPVLPKVNIRGKFNHARRVAISSKKEADSGIPAGTLKVGSMNLNGIDFEGCWYVKDLFLSDEFDVSTDDKIFLT